MKLGEFHKLPQGEVENLHKLIIRAGKRLLNTENRSVARWVAGGGMGEIKEIKSTLISMSTEKCIELLNPSIVHLKLI